MEQEKKILMDTGERMALCVECECSYPTVRAALLGGKTTTAKRQRIREAALVMRKVADEKIELEKKRVAEMKKQPAV